MLKKGLASHPCNSYKGSYPIILEAAAMEQYVLVGELTDQRTANRVCSALESSSVPVMIEHFRRSTDLGPELVYRILVPVELSQRSLGVLAGILVTHTALDSPSGFEAHP